MRTWIKICGTTSLEDALASVAAGADALGFIFAPSKRRVTIAVAQQIVAGIPEEIERIGVFVNESAGLIRATIKQVGLTAVQLHGEEPPDFVFGLHDEICVLKTILIRDGWINRLEQFVGRREAPDLFLLDSGSGSGKTFDWKEVRPRLAGRAARFILAGGLGPGNVGQAIRTLAPWGVDVVSGVEREPGRKDPEKLKAFVAAVRNAEER